MKYYKITSADLNTAVRIKHNLETCTKAYGYYGQKGLTEADFGIDYCRDLVYHDGIVVDPLEFDPKPNCGGGLHFSSVDILMFLNYGCMIREVVPDAGKMVKINDTSGIKYKAPQLLCKPRRLITDDVIIELVNEGARIDRNIMMSVDDHGFKIAAEYIRTRLPITLSTSTSEELLTKADIQNTIVNEYNKNGDSIFYGVHDTSLNYGIGIGYLVLAKKELTYTQLCRGLSSLLIYGAEYSRNKNRVITRLFLGKVLRTLTDMVGPEVVCSLILVDKTSKKLIVEDMVSAITFVNNPSLTELPKNNSESVATRYSKALRTYREKQAAAAKASSVRSRSKKKEAVFIPAAVITPTPAPVAVGPKRDNRGRFCK